MIARRAVEARWSLWVFCRVGSACRSWLPLLMEGRREAAV